MPVSAAEIKGGSGSTGLFLACGVYCRILAFGRGQESGSKPLFAAKVEDN